MKQSFPSFRNYFDSFRTGGLLRRRNLGKKDAGSNSLGRKNVKRNDFRQKDGLQNGERRNEEWKDCCGRVADSL